MLAIQIFLPAAALVFLSMWIAAIPKPPTARHLLPYRVALLVASAIGAYFHDVVLVMIVWWLALCVPGLWVFLYRRDMFRSPSLVKLVLPFQVTRFIWRGFQN